MNDKLLIFEDTDGDGKADKMHRLRRRPAQPDRVRVLQRRRHRRPGPGPMFLKDTNGDDKADVRERDRPRPRHRRHAPHREQLRPRPGRGALLPGRHVPPHAGRRRPTARRSGSPTAASSATSRARRSSTCTSPTASPTRTGTSSTAGARTSSSTAPGRTRTTPPLFSGHLPFPHKHDRPPQVYQQRTRPCGGMEILSSRHFPPECEGNLLVTNVHRLPGHPAVQARATTAASFDGHGAGADPVQSTDPNFRPSD